MIEKLFTLRSQAKRFLIICPNCDEQMKQLRKNKNAEFYSCANCYKSWIYEKTLNEDGKIVAVFTETDFKRQ